MIWIDRPPRCRRDDRDREPSADERHEHLQLATRQRTHGVVRGDHFGARDERVRNVEHRVGDRDRELADRRIAQAVAEIDESRHPAAIDEHVLIVDIAVNDGVRQRREPGTGTGRIQLKRPVHQRPAVGHVRDERAVL